MFDRRGDFSIMFNPDNTERRESQQVMIFHQLELACKYLADISYKRNVSPKMLPGNSPRVSKSLYKNFIYSRMLWSKFTFVAVMIKYYFVYCTIVLMAMKFHENSSGRLGPKTRSISVVWDYFLVKHHERVRLSHESITELEAGLEVEQLLEIPPLLSFSHGHLTNFLAKHDDKNLRTFLELM